METDSYCHYSSISTSASIDACIFTQQKCIDNKLPDLCQLRYTYNRTRLINNQHPTEDIITVGSQQTLTIQNVQDTMIHKTQVFLFLLSLSL
jgi:hypothetical protein